MEFSKSGSAANHVGRLWNLTLSVLVLTVLVPLTAWGQVKLTFKDHGKVIKELTVDDLKGLTPLEKVQVHDADEMNDVTYDVFSMGPILEKIYGKKQNGEELLFTCLDGYQPSIPLKNFKERHAYLAVSREGGDFAIVNKHEGGKRINVGPFYLVWEKADGIPHDEDAWPYQVTTVDLVSFADTFPRLAPPPESSAQVVRGFLAFRKSCVGCHTLNGDGGKGGPELNYPVNVTEYYKLDWLKKWILAPQSIRYKTGMPGLEKSVHHREDVVDDIISYFQAMSKNKIKPKDL